MRRVSRRHRLEGHLWKQAVRPLGTATLTRGGVTRIGRCLTTPTELTRTASRNRRCEIPPKRRPPGRDCPPSTRREGRTPDALAPKPRVAPKPWLSKSFGPLVKGKPKDSPTGHLRAAESTGEFVKSRQNHDYTELRLFDESSPRYPGTARKPYRIDTTRKPYRKSPGFHD